MELAGLPSDARLYLRPTAFIDAPFGHDGQVARLAGGLCWFSGVELIVRHDDRRIAQKLIPLDRIEQAFESLPPALESRARALWARLTSARAPLTLGERTLRFDQPHVMGILNRTPDSFSDGGRHAGDEAATASAIDMAAAGAAIIDIGGESTRPGAEEVWEGDEIERVLPVIERLRPSGIPISIDTRKSAVMEAALAAGAHIVNDVSALTFDPRSAELVARAGCPVVLMHHQGKPETMQQAPAYRDALLDVFDWLEERIDATAASGIARDRIVIDPGIGFGKALRHNLAIINGLSLFHGLGCPVLLGASRKRIIGALSGEAPVEQRLGGSLALVMAGLVQGVQIVRVHDVPESVQAMRVWRGLRDAALTP